jgi:hypothetical protein
MEEMIQIEKWKLDKIEDAMRININAHSMKNKECCAHRQMMKAYAWVVQALEVVSSVPQANELLPHVSVPKGTFCARGLTWNNCEIWTKGTGCDNTCKHFKQNAL